MNELKLWQFRTDPIENWAYLDDVFTKEECEQIIEIGNKNLEEGTIGSGEIGRAHV